MDLFREINNEVQNGVSMILIVYDSLGTVYKRLEKRRNGKSEDESKPAELSIVKIVKNIEKYPADLCGRYCHSALWLKTTS